MSLSPSDIAEIDQAIAEAQPQLDHMLLTLAGCQEKAGDTQGYLDFGAYMQSLAGENPKDFGSIASLAMLRLLEAQGGAS